MLPNACRSFFTLTFILSITFHIRFALAGSFIVDDWDPNKLNWHGAWTGFNEQPAPTWDRTLTWGNLSGSTVAFAFTGTSVEVFGAFKPVGVWSMQSQYTIDGGEPTTIVPPQEVHVEVYNQSLYYSGRLRPGQHTLVVTNLGPQLWLDYFLVTNDGDKIIPSSGSPTIVASTTTSPIQRPTTTSSSAPTAHDSTHSTTENESTTISASTSSSLNIPTPSHANTSVPASNASFPTTSPSTTTVSLSSLLLSPILTSSSSTNSPPRGAGTISSSGTSHAVPASLIAGVTIAGIFAFMLLLVFACWFRRKRNRRGLGRVSYPFSGSTACGEDLIPRPNPSTYAPSFRESQYSATLFGGPRLSRPASSLTDFVGSYADRPHSVYRRSMDAGVTIAGGPGADAGDAPSISEAQSIKSRLPPLYQAYGNPTV